MNTIEQVAKSVLFMEYIEHKVKHYNGLIDIAEHEITQMLDLSEDDNYQFEVVVRNETWSKELGDDNIKSIPADIKNNKQKYDLLCRRLI